VFLTHPTAGGTNRESYSMQRQAGRWLVAYDFYMANRLLGK
jgi:hypothetical protein